MLDKFLCLIATFDEETTKRMKEIEQAINKVGIIGKQTPNLPHHITLAYFDTSYEDAIKERLEKICGMTKSFNLSFNHIGLFGLKVLFLAPDVNNELLKLHKSLSYNSLKNDQGWTAHITILIDEAEKIQQAIPIVAENFQQLDGRVESISLYEFFPTRFIVKYDLQ